MEWLRGKSLINSLLFPAPEPSYTARDFPGSLVWIRQVGPGEPLSLPALFVQNPRGARFVVLYMHGNGEDLGHIRDHLIEYARHWKSHVLACEYPSYGAAHPSLLRGVPSASEETVVRSARSALSFIEEELGVPPWRVVLFGRSIGTGPAVLLASHLAEVCGGGAFGAGETAGSFDPANSSSSSYSSYSSAAAYGSSHSVASSFPGGSRRPPRDRGDDDDDGDDGRRDGGFGDRHRFPRPRPRRLSLAEPPRSRTSPAALVLQSPYTSIKSLALTLVGPPARLMLPRLVTSAHISKVECPILFLHGKKDDLIPFGHSLELRRMAAKSKGTECVIWENSGHDDWDHIREVVNPVAEFLSVWARDGSVDASTPKSQQAPRAAASSFVPLGGLDGYGDIDPCVETGIHVYQPPQQPEHNNYASHHSHGMQEEEEDDERDHPGPVLDEYALIDIFDITAWSEFPPAVVSRRRGSVSSSNGAHNAHGANHHSNANAGNNHGNSNSNGNGNSGGGGGYYGHVHMQHLQPRLSTSSGSSASRGSDDSSPVGWASSIIDGFVGGIATVAELSVGAFASESPPREHHQRHGKK